MTGKEGRKEGKAARDVMDESINGEGNDRQYRPLVGTQFSPGGLGWNARYFPLWATSAPRFHAPAKRYCNGVHDCQLLQQTSCEVRLRVVR